MEKIQYHLWKAGSASREAFRDSLLENLPELLIAAGVRASRAAIYDDFVDQRSSVRVQSTALQPDAVVSVWVDTANDYFRAPVDAAVRQLSAAMHAYLVTESEPIPNKSVPEEPGRRLEGMNQIVFLQKPDRLSYREWLSIWHNSHSFVGIGTQSTYAYRQNVVVRALSYAAPHYDAFVEECFPEQAIDDLAYYYDDQGEKAAEWDSVIDAHFPRAVEIRQEMASKPRWKINSRIMTESCMRFIDMGQDPHFCSKIDCRPYSEYILIQA